MNGEIDRGMEKLAKAQDRAAIGGEFAPDYKVVKGVKFHYQTVAHSWVIPYLVGLPQLQQGVIVLYALAHNSEDVLNVVLPQILDGSALMEATKFFVRNGIRVEDLNGLDAELLQHPYASGAEEAPAENPTDAR